jgi:TonB family protein
MSYSPPPRSSPFDASSGRPLSTNKNDPPQNDLPVEAEVNDESKSTALLQILRDALASGTHAPDAVLRATANAARILTGAEGIAIALPAVRGIACRARSGDLAPELGTAVSLSSGITGECLRTSRTLHCADTQNDSRVDAAVCRQLGIRSISVVPLRDGTITFGILEVLSSRIGAFGEEQIHFLNDLAEIAEGAYRLEIRGKKLPVEKPVGILPDKRREPISPSVSEADEKPLRNYWPWGPGVVLGVLVCAIIWWTWHGPMGESDAVEDTQQSAITTPLAAAKNPPATPKPSPTIAPNDKTKHGLLRNAAKIESLTGLATKKPPQNTIQPTPSSGNNATPRSTPDTNSTSIPNPASTSHDSPSGVVASNAHDDNSTVALTPSASSEVQISEGGSDANLIHKVVPIYPAEARSARLEGPVTLLASIAEDGSVSRVTLVRGEATLATAAIEAVKQWRYTPSLLDGKPTAVEREITVIFKLQ